MKKLIISKIKVKQIKDKNLTSFKMDFDNDGFCYPLKSNGRNKVGKIITQDGKTHASIGWIPDGGLNNSTIHHFKAKYTAGETYLIDQYQKVKIETVELLQRENTFYWKYTISLVE
jgi:hypothetical protein